jgi:hypothetical protein
MTETLYSPTRMKISAAFAVALSSFIVAGAAPASADEAGAKKLLKAMSDYVGKQPSLSFDYDSVLEVVTKDDQKLALASSGTVNLTRPDKLRATRAGGFADVETLFDGKTLTLVGKNANLYTQVAIAGTIEHLVDELREKYHRHLPAADLILSNSYDELMQDVTDVKDLGSGVVGGVECDFLAFRKPDVDFQVWIAQGDKPYPCRFSITSRQVSGNPQYTVQVRNWKAPSGIVSVAYAFKNPTNAKKVELTDLQDKLNDLPGHFKTGADK